jgi:hypothetical protein
MDCDEELDDTDEAILDHFDGGNDCCFETCDNDHRASRVAHLSCGAPHTGKVPGLMTTPGGRVPGGLFFAQHPRQGAEPSDLPLPSLRWCV